MEEGWRQRDELTSHERLEVLDLLNRLEAVHGRESLDENRRRVVLHRGVADHWLQYRAGKIVGFAITTGPEPCVVEVAGGHVDTDLLVTLLEQHASLEWWSRDSANFPDSGRVVRTLQLMEVDLPVAVAPIPSGVTIRNFDPAVDSERWLNQNNLAFADHPEQGAWRLDDLRMRVREPWFDPSGFLLFEQDSEIVASCWTKIHELHPDRLGEIYVISVHPAHQGRGLGRVAVTHGLENLRRHGVTRAQLFVDESNGGARALYLQLGFRTVREDHLVRFER
jgi:mycothiol synthase